MGILSILGKEKISNLTYEIGTLKEFQLDNYFETRVLGRAYDYLDHISFTQVEKESIKAIINGSSKYEVEFSLDDDTIIISCTCPYDKSCKHIAAVLLSIMDINF